MFYHASPIKGIKVLEPRVSNHNKPLIYFSSKRENTLVYLSNAIEKYCKDNNYNYDGTWSKWGPYGFTKDGILELHEYYPNATDETYKGVNGYIYKVEEREDIKKQEDIQDAFITNKPVEVSSVEYIKDAYEEIQKEIKLGHIVLIKYEDFIKDNKEWLSKTIKKEYKEAINHPEYRFFLENKFPFLKRSKE